MHTLAITKRVLASLVVTVLVAGCGTSAASGNPGSGSPGSATASAATNAQASQSGAAAGNATSGSFDQIPAIVAEVEPSVVTVLRTDAEGSGVVWASDGTIITNNHVVEGVKNVVIVFADGTRVDGTVLATDPLSDLAVVKTNRQGLPAAKWADRVPPVGSLAIAIGNPLGFENSVTAGIISGTGRAVPGAAQQAPALVDLVQTDAAISPGNSGGALVGGDARIIGVNVAYIPPSASAVSIGFAIPAPTVTDVVKQLIDKGKAAHAYLGVQPVPLTPQIATEFGLKSSRARSSSRSFRTDRLPAPGSSPAT
jgi:serine protease DegQ